MSLLQLQNDPLTAEEVRAVERARKIWPWARLGPIAILVPLVGVLLALERPWALAALIGVTVVGGALLQTRLRCPRCNQSLIDFNGQPFLFPDDCPSCGVEFRKLNLRFD